MPAATSDPNDIVSATVANDQPAVNRKPAMIGASTEPPRPTPTATPVPDARTCVGKTCAMIAYIPTIAALVQKPAAAQIIDNCCRSGGVLPKRATITVESTITTIVSPFTPNLSVRSPSTAPPIAPPTFVHTSTP